MAYPTHCACNPFIRLSGSRPLGTTYNEASGEEHFTLGHSSPLTAPKFSTLSSRILNHSLSAFIKRMSNTMENPSQSTLAGHPVMLPPLGVQSDFDNPQTHGATLIVLSIIFTTLALIAVCFRLYARRRLPRQPFWWDDGQSI